MAATAGYSNTPLLQKLGTKPAMKVLLLNAPDNYFDLLETDISAQLLKPKEVPGFIHLFATNNKAYKNGLQKILPLCKKNTAVIVWVSWYKKSAGIVTDLTEDIIRN